MILICFDIRDKKRLRNVAKTLEGVGQRVQHSVFECHLDSIELAALKSMLATIINPAEDNIRYYPLCPKDRPEIKIDGPGRITEDPDYHLL
ncbi:MAG: CRISPR-associated endonuclease Cas2 [Thiotrichaceae bacterium]|nr:CRISPR-associated endonuclease Cas2 [Thiotrichaceae bacterium]PCI13437.1 MAG: CRISPR-associated endonuclease Cas2 [Thiotrichales bacterium]